MRFEPQGAVTSPSPEALEPHRSHTVQNANYLDSLEVFDFDSGFDSRRLHHSYLI